MAGERIVVGATGDDEGAREAARRLRDGGHEIVYVGGRQTPEQLVRAAIAEDAVQLVVDADDRTIVRVVQLCRELSAEDIRVERVV